MSVSSKDLQDLLTVRQRARESLTEVPADLLPCPFCGSSARLMKWDECGWCYRVSCKGSHCGATIVPTGTAERSIAEWNNRQAPSEAGVFV